MNCDVKVHVCAGKWLESLMTILRNQKTDRAEFKRAAGLVGDFLLMEAVNAGFIPMRTLPSLTTPTGAAFTGVEVDTSSVVAVSILRAGNAFAASVDRVLSPSVSLGQIVIQRDELSATAKTLLVKLPAGIAQAECVVVLDPMLATGGSAIAAVNILLSRGVAVERIVLVHAVGCPEGLAALRAAFPSVRVVLGVQDSHLSEQKYIIPGLGDFGDRFYCDP